MAHVEEPHTQQLAEPQGVKDGSAELPNYGYAEDEKRLSASLSHPTAGSPTPDGEEPTNEELQTLQHVADKLPWAAWLIAVIELCERFAFYGLVGCLQNYMQNPANSTKLPGAIGKLFFSADCVLEACRIFLAKKKKKEAPKF